MTTYDAKTDITQIEDNQILSKINTTGTVMTYLGKVIELNKHFKEGQKLTLENFKDIPVVAFIKGAHPPLKELFNTLYDNASTKDKELYKGLKEALDCQELRYTDKGELKIFTGRVGVRFSNNDILEIS